MNKFFDAPIDASHFNSSLGTIAGAKLAGIGYESGMYRWRAIDADGNVVSGDDVYGTNVASPSESAAAVDIKADVARTLP